MSEKKYRIKLTQEERETLEAIRDKGSHQSITYRRAIALLMSDESELGQGCTDATIDKAIGMRTRTVERLRQKVHELGVLPALERSPRLTPANPPKITGELEAHITRIACSQCPEGAARWTLQLIADELVRIEVIDSISATTVGKVLKKMNLNHGSKKAGVFHQSKTPVSSPRWRTS